MSNTPRLVVIITGANSGVGFAVCQRLLKQLCRPNPPDAYPQAFASGIKSAVQLPVGYHGLTLILACRNLKRATAAQKNLLEYLDQLVDLEHQSPEEKEYAHAFRQDCDIQIEELDLASLKSVFNFCSVIRTKVPYVSHLLCNAGFASFAGLDWFLLFKQLFTKGILDILTYPIYYVQRSEEISGDNFGYVWQCNVFGHFVLFRDLQPLLEKSPFDFSRVIWCSSLEALPGYFDSNDWQLIKSRRSYEASKYQIDLIATSLSSPRFTCEHIRHLIMEPGVCDTQISYELTKTPLFPQLKILLFYVARMLGSVHHSMQPFKAAIAAVHLILVPLVFLPTFLNGNCSKPTRFGAHTTRWGSESVGISEVYDWDGQKEQGAILVQKCDELYQSLKARKN